MRYDGVVHVISRKALRQFWEQHPDSEMPLARWTKLMEGSEFANFAQLRGVFPNADKVGQFIIFNISGNKYRLIATIHFNRSKVFIRHVLTHKEYDQGAWKK